jgi:RHS repeat-associated protein
MVASSVKCAEHYNYFRDYDPAIGRYVESDPFGLRGGLNTFGYVSSRPTLLIDRMGLTAADVQGVGRDVMMSYADVNPQKLPICFRKLTLPNLGETDPSSGEICIDPSWETKPCFTKKEYRELFFTLFHEGMHSTDNRLMRYWTNITTDRHGSIYRREILEGGGSVGSGSIWGTPRSVPVDIDRLYDQYRGRTPACCAQKAQ